MLDQAFREYLHEHVRRLAQRYVSEKNIQDRLADFNNTIKSLFSDLVKEYSVEEISKKTGYTQDYIKRILNDRKPLPFSTFIRVALGLGYDIDINLKK